VARKTLTKTYSPAKALAARVNDAMKRVVITTADDARFQIERVPTGSLVIDRLTGGGFARGRHVLLYGDWMVGKSLILYMTMARAQARGEVCALVDGEKVFDADWFTSLGGNPDELLMYQPEREQFTANEIGNILRLLIDRGDPEIGAASIIGIDSVASLVPEEELKHDLEEGDARVASQARLMSLLLRVLTSSNDKTLFIWTNQWRDKISRIPNLKSNPGGRALGFYSSTMIEMMSGERETVKHQVPYKGKQVERKKVIGQWVNCTLTKEKTGGRPFDTMPFMLDFETKQIDMAREIIDIGMRDGLVVRSGDYYSLVTPDEQGARMHSIGRAIDKLHSDDEIREFLTLCIEEGHGIG
jgi:protein RecA